jgi:Protein of unknown function (DUF2530)
VSQSRQGGTEERRPAPPPKEADDRQVTAVITVGWAIALAVVVTVRRSLPADARWWVWTCAFGLGMGLFGLWYVPFLKRHRARLAARRAQLDEVSGASGAGGVSGPAGDSGYVSRDSGSNAVSSTETPGRSTKS